MRQARSSSSTFIAVLLGSVVLAVPLLPAAAQPPAGARLLSATSDGTPGDGSSFGPAISADGSTVVFGTVSTNLIAGTDDQITQLVAADTATGALTLISHAPDGSIGNDSTSGAGSAHSASVSADGSVVAFISDASNLVAGDTNELSDAFAWTRATDTITRISVLADGTESPEGASTVELTADGSQAVITLEDSTIFGGRFSEPAVIVKDLATGAVELISREADGTPEEQVRGAADISDDGRYVLYLTDRPHSPLDDNGNGADLYRYDRQAGVYEPVSVASDGRMPGGLDLTNDMDGSGNRIVFLGPFEETFTPDTPNEFQTNIYLRDMAAGTTELVSRDSAGNPVIGDTSDMRISADGNHVTFIGPASISEAGSDLRGTFIRNLTTGVTDTLAIQNNPARADASNGADTIAVTIREEDFSTQIYVFDGGVPPPPPPVCTAPDGDPATTERLAESDPVRVAVAISCGLWADAGAPSTAGAPSASHVVLSRDDAFADSLAGSALAGGPLLFTGSASLHPLTAAEIRRVLPAGGTVYLLGGDVAVSVAVSQSLTDLGYQPERLAGPSRIETALAVADEVLALPSARPEGQVLLARAFNAEGNPTSGWADSVTGGAYAAATGQPVIITPTESLHPAVATWLEDHADLQPVLLGGEAALSAAVADSVTGAERVAGDSRFATNAAILETLFGSTDVATTSGPRTVSIINGEDPLGWAYGLAAASTAGPRSAPLVLTGNGSTVREVLATYLSACGDAEVEVLLVGTTSIIADGIIPDLDAIDGPACS